VSYQLVNARVWDGTQWVNAVNPTPPADNKWYSIASGFSHTYAQINGPAPSSSANTKGAWFQLTASTAADTTFLYLLSSGWASGASQRGVLLDGGTGAAGSETTIAGNIAIGSWILQNERWSSAFQLPVAIPAGTRIAVRAQQNITGGATGRVSMGCVNMGVFSDYGTAIDVLGTSTSTSLATQLSATPNTYVELTASTSHAYQAIAVLPNVYTATAETINDGRVRVAYGAPGSEVVVATTSFQSDTNERLAPLVGNLVMHPCNIPAGSRLAVTGSGYADGSNYGVCVIGVRA